MRRPTGFTLIETLVVVSVIAIVLGALLPALSGARDAARSAACLANHRSVFLICRAYANEHGGVGPAIGQPWGEVPNWALLVMTESGRAGENAADLYSKDSALVCPTVQAVYGQEMTRTYAMNATGHAGVGEDADSFDDAMNPGHINFDRIGRTSETALLVDSSIAFIPGDAPPPTRTSSVLDFRDEGHITSRLGVFHVERSVFNAAMFDGSARHWRDVPEHWREPLP